MVASTTSSVIGARGDQRARGNGFTSGPGAGTPPGDLNWEQAPAIVAGDFTSAMKTISPTVFPGNPTGNFTAAVPSSSVLSSPSFKLPNVRCTENSTVAFSTGLSPSIT